MAVPPNQLPAQKSPPVPPLKTLIKYSIALLVIGGLGEWLNKNVSPLSGYGLVWVVIFAYAITGDKLTSLTDFLTSIGLATK